MQTATVVPTNLGIAFAAIMHDHNHRPNLKVLWEYIEEPNAEELLRQVARLILEDRQQMSPEMLVDKESLRTLNECVPVEEQKRQISTNE